MRISILDDETVAKIAAGEVVERPASIVKELVENSIDAGARRVVIEVENGGKTSIRVSDDGYGMSGEDIGMALERHATSKIRKSEDLWDLKTYGFRGEALSSIRAVSRLEILSRREPDNVGHQLICEGMGKVKHTEVARQSGTTVTVSELFFNTTARRKFLKTAATEFRHILKTVMSYALARIDIEFVLRRDGKQHLHAAPGGSLTDRIDSLYSVQYRDKLIEVLLTGGDVTLGGFVIDPNQARRRGAEQWLFVNGRPFFSRPVVAAIHEGYRTTLPPGTSPDFMLFLTMSPADVDANVHPTKKEVKFRDQKLIFDRISSSVREALGMQGSASPSITDLHRLSSRKYIIRDGEHAPGLKVADPGSRQMALFMSAAAGESKSPVGEEEAGAERPVLFQLHQTYIVATTDSGLVVIDQHSAHERIIYEELINSFLKDSVDAQRLLFPLTVHLSHNEETILQEYLSLLQKFGFQAEPFGDRTYLLQAVPAITPGFDVESSFHSILGDLSGKGMHEMNQYERLAKVIACRTAIKAGTPLVREMMSELLDGLFATDLPFSDIHGRPTVVQIDLGELNRRFGRT